MSAAIARSIDATWDIEQETRRIDELDSGLDVFRYFKRICSGQGMKKFIVLDVPPSLDAVQDASIVHDWDPEMVYGYDASAMAASSVVLERSRERNRPFRFEVDELYEATDARPRDKERIELFGDFGIRNGVCYPVRASSGSNAAIVMLGGEGSGTDDVHSFHILAHYAFDKLSADRSQGQPKNVLSERETQCLTWTAAGKTSAEIAMILDLSEHTVSHYIVAACKKLDATNRVQAVAKAIRLGLLAE